MGGFLSHNTSGCASDCNSCGYWSRLWPDAVDRISKLNTARDRIAAFRKNYLPYLELNSKARAVLGQEIDAIYRDCQEFATTRIKEAVEDVLRELVPAKPGRI